MGEKIRLLRTMKGLSQENMADMVGISRLTYGEIERGKSEPTTDRLEKIAEVLGISTDDIETFGDKVSNFFDQCNSPQVNAGIKHTNHQTNHYDAREMQHALEKAQLEIEKLKLEKEKAEWEAKYWREKMGQ